MDKVIRRFEIHASVYATLDIDPRVLDAVDDEWRRQFYNLRTVEEIAQHIAYNLLANDARLSMLDGWADHRDDEADLHTCEWNVDVEEIPVAEGG